MNHGAETVHRGHWTRDDRAAGLWPRLPFEVPARCAGVSVELSYDRGGGAVLDLGCEVPPAGVGGRVVRAARS
jgi:hypothetical protein